MRSCTAKTNWTNDLIPTAIEQKKRPLVADAPRHRFPPEPNQPGSDDFLDMDDGDTPWLQDDLPCEGDDTLFGAAADTLPTPEPIDITDRARLFRAHRIVLADGDEDAASASTLRILKRRAPAPVPSYLTAGTDAFEFTAAAAPSQSTGPAPQGGRVQVSWTADKDIVAAEQNNRPTTGRRGAFAAR